MQQYLFRGKRKDNGAWVEGCLVQWPDGDREIVVHNGTNETVKYTVIPETVGMWTGLKDKNGINIYQGDILKAFTPSVPCYEVFYCRSSYRLRYKLKSNEFYDWGPLFRMEEIMHEGRLKMFPEVIGNIHDTPELLNPTSGKAGINHMYDPKEQATEGQQEEVAATESAAQDSAMEVTADSEEGGAEG